MLRRNISIFIWFALRGRIVECTLPTLHIAVITQFLCLAPHPTPYRPDRHQLFARSASHFVYHPLLLYIRFTCFNLNIIHNSSTENILCVTKDNATHPKQSSCIHDIWFVSMVMRFKIVQCIWMCVRQRKSCDWHMFPASFFVIHFGRSLAAAARMYSNTFHLFETNGSQQ